MFQKDKCEKEEFLASLTLFLGSESWKSSFIAASCMQMRNGRMQLFYSSNETVLQNH